MPIIKPADFGFAGFIAAASIKVNILLPSRMQVIRYSPLYKDLWNDLVRKSPTGTFLHERGYMDYHSDRFEDFSIMVFENQRLLACLPCNRQDATIVSHAGLTYGGWQVDSRYVNTVKMLQIWEASLNFMKAHGFSSLRYKAVPSIYHRYPMEDDIYSVFRFGGNIDCCLISCAVNLDCPIAFDTNATRNVKFAQKQGIEVRETSDFAAFWDILTELLDRQYNTKPVHTLREIELLKSRFPDNIRLYGAFNGESLIAGVVVYNTETVSKAQYIASTNEGRAMKALPAVFAHIMSSANGRRYFDFGTSNENHGLFLNEGLIRQKSGMGGRGIAYITYSIPIL